MTPTNVCFLVLALLRLGVCQSEVLTYYARAIGSQVKLPIKQGNRTSPATSATGQFSINVYNSSYANGVAYITNLGGAFMSHVHVGDITAPATYPETNQPVAWTWNSTLAPPLTAWLPLDIIDGIRFNFVLPQGIVPQLASQLQAGSVYVDVHSTSYKMGEIRGLMQKVANDIGQ